MHKAVLILWEIGVCWTSRGSCAPGSDDGGGGRRAINDGIEGKGGYLHNDWGKKTFPRFLRICRYTGVYTTENKNRNLLVNNSIKKRGLL